VADALCRHFGPCGGCDWQDLTYPEQLARKRQILTDLLRASLGRRAPPVEPVVAMPTDATGWPWGFRHKASFVFGERDRVLTIGHYAAASNRVIPIVECPVHTDRANRIAFTLHEHLARARIPAAGPDGRGVLRYLLVRTTRDLREAVAMLVVTRNEKTLRTPIKKFLSSAERPSGFLLNIHDRPGPYMVGRETIKIDGRSHVKERIRDISFLVSPTTFFQTNAAVAAVLVDLVLAHAPPTSPLHAVDLYSGSGLFALPLASQGHRVVAVEDNDQAVTDGEANARLNQLGSRVRFLHARVEEALSQLAGTRSDLVVMDPPRAGCPAAVIDRLFGDLKPPAVVYVSCNPEALARELPSILENGYGVGRVQPVDMFPHTTHLETVVSLTRERP
jgi:23S rRNA (uracil1939-C5)-methyltransferase